MSRTYLRTSTLFLVLTTALAMNPQSGQSAQPLAQEQQDPQLDVDIAKLDVLRSSGTLDAMRAQIDLDSAKWRGKDRSAYLVYMYRACGELSSYDIGDLSQRALLLSQYAISVLQSGDLPLPQYVQFVEFLGFDPPTIDPAAWKDLRRQKAEFWLEALHRVNQATDSHFDFNNRPLLNIAPPPSTGLPSGISPAAITNPQIRTEYEKAIAQNNAKNKEYTQQSWLKLNGPSISKEVEHYLVRAYSQAPSDISELQGLLSKYDEDASMRNQVIKEVQKSQNQ